MGESVSGRTHNHSRIGSYSPWGAAGSTVLGRSSPDVLVVGEALIDIVETGDWTTEHVGGSPANVALGLGRRGVSTALLTQIADDARGAAIVEHLRESAVDVLVESFSLRRTATALAHVAPDGHAEYEFDLRWDALPHLEPLRPRVLHTGSVAAFLEPGAADVRRMLERSHAEYVTFDPNIRPALLPRREVAVRTFEETVIFTNVVKMSDQDAAWLYPTLGPTAVIDAVLALGPRLVAISLGGDGAILATENNRVKVDAVTVDAVDTIGAGDTFMASLIHSLLIPDSSSLDRGVLMRIGGDAVRAAAVTVSRAGANLPWLEEL